MTDNEKAATFIGWKPEYQCNGNGCPLWHWVSVAVNEAQHIDDFPPDMSDPRNYMKALEDRNQYFRIVHDLYLDSYTCEFDGGIRTLHQKSVGESVVKALAELYDAEHS